MSLPDILPPLDAAALKAQRLAEFKAMLPDWNTELESDPVVMLIELLAYVETLDQAGDNEAILANVLGYAHDKYLDELARWYKLERLQQEQDERFRFRLELHIRGLSGMGTEDYYRAKALAAGLWVLDANIAADRFGALTITVWLTNDAPADAILQATAYLTAKQHRMATDTITVNAAIAKPLAVLATLYRADDTPAARVDEARGALQRALTQAVGLGAHIDTSWLIGRLAVPGISRVELVQPTAGLICASHEYPAVTTLDIKDGGLA